MLPVELIGKVGNLLVYFVVLIVNLHSLLEELLSFLQLAGDFGVDFGPISL